MRRLWTRCERKSDQAFYGGKREGRGAERFVLPDGDEERRTLARRRLLLPPSDTGGEARHLAMVALDAAPKSSKPLLIGDLNSDLDFSRDRQDEVLSADLEERGLRCVTRGYLPRRTRRMRGRLTWRQRRTLQSGARRNLRSKPDYFLTRGRDRGRVRRCCWIQARHHNLDHRALLVQIRARPWGGCGST